MSRNNSNAKFYRTWISDEEFFSADLLNDEEWIFFEDYKGAKLSGTYGVSNMGRVKCQDGSIMKGSIDEDGYHHVSFAVRDCPNKSIAPGAHSVVLHMFIGPPPADMVDPTVQHINHDKLDNRLANLCWMSQFDNNQEGHATRAKIIDKNGEHIFGSQKAASSYIGRYEDYISECIHNNYKITTADNEDIDVYTEVDGQWIQYCRTQPGNRHWCRVIQANKTFDFESFKACDRFLEEAEGYTSNCVANSWPIRDSSDFAFYIHDGEQYIEYVPTKKRWKGARRCQIITNDGEELLFDSITAAARYIGKDSEYVRINARDGRCIRDKDGNVVNIVVLDAEEPGRVQLAKECSQIRV